MNNIPGGPSGREFMQCEQDVPCAICGPGTDFRVLYPAHLKSADLNSGQLFSARRIPGRLHFRIVRCLQCGLTYSNPIYAEEKIKELYRKSEFIDDPFLKTQMMNVANDYAVHLRKAISYLGHKESFLDIGCGNGFFMKIARDLGLKDIRGVEPGIDAIQKADPGIRAHIINDVFHDGLFENDRFDVVSACHVLDHIIHPNDFLKGVRQIVKPGGVVLFVLHNVKFLLTRLVGERAPMFHIEHVYLFDKSTIKKIFEKNNFTVLYNEDLLCSYTLAHAIKMVPVPISFKNLLLNHLRGKTIADMRIKLMPGDMLVIARK